MAGGKWGHLSNQRSLVLVVSALWQLPGWFLEVLSSWFFLLLLSTSLCFLFWSPKFQKNKHKVKIIKNQIEGDALA
jgi:hypothetical protein